MLMLLNIILGVFPMEPGDKWIDELARRHDKIDPIRGIPNSALFKGQ
jgi:hypothetical protein